MSAHETRYVCRFRPSSRGNALHLIFVLPVCQIVASSSIIVFLDHSGTLSWTYIQSQARVT